MIKNIFGWIKQHKIIVVLMLLLFTLTGTLTLFAQKQDTKLPVNPINKDVIPSAVLLAGSDKEVSNSLKESGLKFKDNKEKEDKNLKETKKSDETEDKQSNKKAASNGLNKNIKTRKIKPNKNKSDRTYFVTTINDGEKVENEAYKFKILQKETDLDVQKQQVLLNGKEVEFSGIVILESGENLIEVVMTYTNQNNKSFKISKKYTVYFNSKLDIKTSLEDGKTISTPQIDFDAYAVKNDKKESIKVIANEKELTGGNDFKFSASLEEGENLIELIAGSGNQKLQQSYIINYKKDKDNETKPSEEKQPPIITVEGLDDSTNKTELTFTVSVTTHDEKPIPYDSGNVNVYLNSKEIGSDWDNTDKAQFTIPLETGANTIKVVAQDGDKSSEKTYNVDSKEETIGKATFSVEAATVGMPYLVPATEVDLKKDIPTSEYIVKLLESYGYSYSNTGTTKTNFYMQYISGNIWNGGQPSIPEGLKKILIEENDIEDSEAIQNDDYTDIYKDSSKLGEFDFTSSSGWMYSVNGVYPSVGFSDYRLRDGDNVRIRFTLILGADVDGGFGGNVGDW